MHACMHSRTLAREHAAENALLTHFVVISQEAVQGNAADFIDRRPETFALELMDEIIDSLLLRRGNPNVVDVFPYRLQGVLQGGDCIL